MSSNWATLKRSSSSRPKSSGHCRQPRYGCGLASFAFSARGRPSSRPARAFRSATRSCGTPWLTTWTAPNSSVAVRTVSSWARSPASAAATSITGMAGVISFPSESVLARHAADRVDLAGLRAGIGQVGPPPGGGDHARRDERQAVEEAGDLLRAAQVIRAGRVLVVDDPRLRRHLLGDLVGVVGRGQSGADVKELPDPRLA